MSARTRRLVLWLLVGLASPPALAELSASIEPGVIDELDTATLTIQHSGTSQVVNLELDALTADFEILGTQSASQYRSLNGRLESSVEYQIRLRPRRTGYLTIPPLPVGNARTQPLRLSVRSVQPDVRDTIERMVFFETELEGNPVYVQGQTVLIRKLYYTSGAQIYSDLPGLPEVEGAVVQPLGETTSRTEQREGQRYGVIEQRFAIFPERSGTLIVPAISVTSSVRLQLAGRIRRTGIRIGTEPLELEVLPIPDAYPADQPWLPARNVQLRDDWTPEQTEYRVGQPIERRVEVRVTGNMASIIPALETSLPEDAFRQYPEPPALENSGRTGGFSGVRQQAFAVVPRTDGDVTVPPLTVTWWDIDAARVRVASTPARSLRITGGAPAAPEPDLGPVAAPSAADPGVEQPARTGAGGVLIALLVLTVAAALTWLMRGRLSTLAGRARALGRHGGSEARTRWQDLLRACRSDDAPHIHEALTRYLAWCFDTSPADALRRFRQAGHGELLDRLNAARYGAGHAVPPQGREVAAAVRTLRARPRPRRPSLGLGGRDEPASDALPELYS